MPTNLIIIEEYSSQKCVGRASRGKQRVSLLEVRSATEARYSRAKPIRSATGINRSVALQSEPMEMHTAYSIQSQ